MWTYANTWIRYLVPLSGTLSRVSQPLSTTCTTLQEYEAERSVVRGERMYVIWYPPAPDCVSEFAEFPTRSENTGQSQKKWCCTLTITNSLRAPCYPFRLWHWNTSPRTTVWCRNSTELTMGRNASTQWVNCEHWHLMTYIWGWKSSYYNIYENSNCILCKNYLFPYLLLRNIYYIEISVYNQYFRYLHGWGFGTHIP